MDSANLEETMEEVCEMTDSNRINLLTARVRELEVFTKKTTESLKVFLAELDAQRKMIDALGKEDK